jgi:hypothetical protein
VAFFRPGIWYAVYLLTRSALPSPNVQPGGSVYDQARTEPSGSIRKVSPPLATTRRVRDAGG